VSISTKSQQGLGAVGRHQGLEAELAQLVRDGETRDRAIVHHHHQRLALRSRREPGLRRPRPIHRAVGGFEDVLNFFQRRGFEVFLRAGLLPVFFGLLAQSLQAQLKDFVQVGVRVLAAESLGGPAHARQALVKRLGRSRLGRHGDAVERVPAKAAWAEERLGKVGGINEGVHGSRVVKSVGKVFWS
jgi:hypothetical protein